MSIQPITAATPGLTAVTGTPTTMTSPPPTPVLNGTLAGIAQNLGMSLDQTKTALKQGSSISDLAAQQGVSRSSLVQLVQSGIQESRQASAQPPLDQTTLDRLVNRAFDRGNSNASATAASQRDAAPGSSSSPGSIYA